MHFQLEALGRWTEELVTVASAEAIAAYGRATDDAAVLALGGRVAPPVFAIVGAWAVLQEAARRMAPEEARSRVVHGDQDILISAPIEAGMELHARAAAIGVHPKQSGTTVVLKTETRDGDGRLLNEQYVTEFYRGLVGDAGGGEPAPDHRMPADLVETGAGRRASPIRSPTMSPPATRRPPVTATGSTSMRISRRQPGCRESSSTGSA